MSEFQGNFLTKIASFIPGYKGYADKEARRDSDKLLRAAIVKELGDAKPKIDQTTSDYMRSGRIAHVEKLGQIKRKLENASTLIRVAPQGYSGLFDTLQVKAEDLDKLYRHDLGVQEKAAQVAGLVAGLGAAKDPAGAIAAVITALEELEALVRQRDLVIAEVR